MNNDDIPNDADGGALRRLIEDGSDLSREMEIDFHVAVPDKASGLAFARIVEPENFTTSVTKDYDGKAWTCTCTRIMVPDYHDLIAVQDMLEELGRPYNAVPDGWGSWGNADGKPGRD